MTRLSLTSRLLGALVVLVAASCGMSSGPMQLSTAGSGGAGARTGGASDLGLARAKLDAGIVPSPEDLPTEGLYAEHDLPIDGPACTEVFCVRAAGAVAASTFPLDAGLDADGGLPSPGTASWVQLGLSSNVDLSTFHRRPLNAALVVDTSCSMAGEKIDSVKTAAAKLVDQLGPDDLLTVVRFDSTSHVVIGPQAVTDKDAFKKKIAELVPGSSTCIVCGLTDGYDAVKQHLDSSRDGRVFLLTDEQPNVGTTSPTAFMTLLTDNSKAGIGLSLFGVGLDFGQEAATKITSARGANYAFLETPEKIAHVFDTDFDLLVTPVAYDLDLKLTPSEGLHLDALYGVPGATLEAVESKVATVFLSRTRSAIVARLTAAAPGAALAHASLSYVDVGGQSHTAALDAVAPQSAPPAFEGHGVQKAVALTRFIVGAQHACARYQAGDLEVARLVSAQVAATLADDAHALGDPDLAGDVAFAQQLADLIAR